MRLLSFGMLSFYLNSNFKAERKKYSDILESTERISILGDILITLGSFIRKGRYLFFQTSCWIATYRRATSI